MTTRNDDPVLTTATPARAAATSPAVRQVARSLGNYGTAALLVALILIFWATTPTFMTLRNIQGVLIIQAVTTLMTLGVMFPLIVGEFDLSVGYLVGFLGILGAFLAGRHLGTMLVIASMVAGGVLVGVINGVLTQRLKISSFIATLGVGIVLMGFTEGLSGGHVLYNNIPSLVVTLGGGYAGPLAMSVWIVLGFAAVLFYVLEHTPVGRSLYAVGGSERVAFLAGIRTGQRKVLPFTVSGLLVGIAAVFALGQNGSANPGSARTCCCPRTRRPSWGSPPTGPATTTWSALSWASCCWRLALTGSACGACRSGSSRCSTAGCC